MILEGQFTVSHADLLWGSRLGDVQYAIASTANVNFQEIRDGFFLFGGAIGIGGGVDYLCRSGIFLERG